MTKLPIKQSQFKTIAEFLYRPAIHGEWTQFLESLESCFDVEGSEIPEIKQPRKRKSESQPKTKMAYKKRYVPKGNGTSRNSTNRPDTIHFSGGKNFAVCNTNKFDPVLTGDFSQVTCRNCLLPKHSARYAN